MSLPVWQRRSGFCDNAIVVVENIERYLEEGFPRTEAVVKATGEIIAHR
ncbi:MAG: hypothetical protein R3C26_19150 [Calditrichia bacterium]